MQSYTNYSDLFDVFYLPTPSNLILAVRGNYVIKPLVSAANTAKQLLRRASFQFFTRENGVIILTVAFFIFILTAFTDGFRVLRAID